MNNWNVFDTNKEAFRVNHSYSYKDGKDYLSLVTLQDKKSLQIALYKNFKTVGIKTVEFDDDGAKQDAIDFIFALKGFDWHRSDIKAVNLKA
jgi:hypothetical protein